MKNRHSNILFKVLGSVKNARDSFSKKILGKVITKVLFPPHLLWNPEWQQQFLVGLSFPAP